MVKTEEKRRILGDLSESSERDETIQKCSENGREYFGIFKLNGWKTTLIIVIGSLLIRTLIYYAKDSNAGRTKDGFLELVPEKYNDDDLVEWEPAPPPISRPEEPGDLGILYDFYICALSALLTSSLTILSATGFLNRQFLVVKLYANFTTQIGKPVVVPEHLKEEAERRFPEHQFNIIASDMMSLNRTMPDVRYPECLNVKYPKKLPQVSVIIVYHNEAWSTLIRTIWSVITQSPKALLKEIILVDDFSEKDYLGRPLQEYVKNFPVPVLLSRTLSRVGLIQARLLGASKAISKVMVFLDAHCECVQGWLEALITPIVERRTNVPAPIIDVLDYNTLESRTATISSRGAFDMSLTFTWDPIPQRILNALGNDRTAGIESPAMAGGLFAIDREYFYKIGSYDEQMKIWGGENLEMSVRVWSCGGRLIAMPCSRVGHIFRANSPYVLPGGADHVIAHNLARMADVWMDTYKDTFYAYNPRAFRERTNVTERKLLRERLQCKSFKWFLENVFIESPFNIKEYKLVEIESVDEEETCLDSMGDSRVLDRSLEAGQCHHQGGNQVFMLTGDNEIREKKFCLDATVPGQPVKLLDCHGSGGNQWWSYDEDTNQIRHGTGENCLTLPEESNVITIQPCDSNEYSQQWHLAPPTAERYLF